MKPASWQEWPATLPGADFADRVVAIAMQEHAARRTTVRRGWALSVAAAVGMAFGVALACVVGRAPAALPAVSADPAPRVAATNGPEAPWIRHAEVAPVHAPAAPEVAPRPAHRAPPRPPTPPPPVPAPAEIAPDALLPPLLPSPRARRTLALPACECSEWVCGCVEVPWLARPLARPRAADDDTPNLGKGTMPCEGIDSSGGCLPVPFSR